MKKAIFLLLFALSATMAFANKTLPDQGQKGDPVKEVLAAVQAASEVAEGEVPCTNLLNLRGGHNLCDLQLRMFFMPTGRC